MRNAMWVGGGITGMGEIPILGVREKGIAKVIRDIFRNGEQGFFYDPNDLSTMFQDAAGTTAVNATGQPLGLVLDKSKNMLLSSEKNPNPSFNANLAGWAVGNATSATFENGEARVTFGGVLSATANNWFSLEGTYSVGKVYTVSFDATYVSGGDLQAGFGYTPGIVVRGSQNLGIKQKYTFTSGGFNSASRLFAFAASSAGSVWKIDNVSVKEVLGNHAYQTTSAARPILRQKPILGSELIVNGDFSNGVAGWDSSSGYPSTADVVNGELRVTPLKDFGRQVQKLNLQVGKEYLITGRHYQLSGTSKAYVAIGYGGDGDHLLITSPSSAQTGVVYFSKLFSPTSSDVRLSLAVHRVDTGTVGVFDNISVKEVTGYRTDQKYIEYDGVDDKLITTLPAQLTGCTVIRAVPNVGTQILTGQTIPATYNDNTDHCGLIVINRALTPSETSAITSEFNKRAGV